MGSHSGRIEFLLTNNDNSGGGSAWAIILDNFERFGCIHCYRKIWVL